MEPFFASFFLLFPRNAWYSGYNSSYPFDTSSLSLAQDDKHQIEAILMQWWEWAWGRYWYHFLSPRDGIKRGGANVVRVVSLILAGNTVENEELETDRWTHWKWNCSTHSANRVCISQEIWIKRNFYFARTLFSRTLCCYFIYLSEFKWQLLLKLCHYAQCFTILGLFFILIEFDYYAQITSLLYSIMDWRSTVPAMFFERTTENFVQTKDLTLWTIDQSLLKSELLKTLFSFSVL